jgi:hypothetical protein
MSNQSVIVQCPVPGGSDQEIVRLQPGEDATFGRGGPGRPVRLLVRHPGVPPLAGRVTAADGHWLLCNLSLDRTYLVENPEGAGEHVKVVPRRLGAPIPFELARVVLPADPAPAQFVVFAPDHRLADSAALPAPDAEAGAAPFALDETAKYFLVLTALCERRLRDGSSAALPTDNEIVARLRGLPACGDLTRSAVNFHLDYLARTKLPVAATGLPRPRLEWRRAALASFALRFDLVREEHLALLPPREAGSSRAPVPSTAAADRHATASPRRRATPGRPGRAPGWRWRG